jgi:hypothetical protein
MPVGYPSADPGMPAEPTGLGAMSRAVAQTREEPVMTHSGAIGELLDA